MPRAAGGSRRRTSSLGCSRFSWRWRWNGYHNRRPLAERAQAFPDLLDKDRVRASLRLAALRQHHDAPQLGDGTEGDRPGEEGRRMRTDVRRQLCAEEAAQEHLSHTRERRELAEERGNLLRLDHEFEVANLLRREQLRRDKRILEVVDARERGVAVVVSSRTPLIDSANPMRSFCVSAGVRDEIAAMTCIACGSFEAKIALN